METRVEMVHRIVNEELDKAELEYLRARVLKLESQNRRYREKLEAIEEETRITDDYLSSQGGFLSI